MVKTNVLKQDKYYPNDFVFVGGHIDEAMCGRVTSDRNCDGTYIVDITNGGYVRLHESSILGKELTLTEQYESLESIHKKTLSDYYDVIQERNDLANQLRITTEELYKLRREMIAKFVKDSKCPPTS